ncbi:hypothetical protein [Clostridium sp.]|uniref:hypothetical protein n=1 Tax=Clostridium sp. TaxID=1506 RepID=UPI003463F0DD
MIKKSITNPKTIIAVLEIIDKLKLLDILINISDVNKHIIINTLIKIENFTIPFFFAYPIISSMLVIRMVVPKMTLSHC